MAKKDEKDGKGAAGTAVTVAPKNVLATISEDTRLAIHDDAQEDLDFGREDMAVPFLRILQSNSPEVQPRNAKQVEGAAAGMFMDTVSKELLDGLDGFIGIPVTFSRSITEWRPRGEGGGGGLVKDWGTDESPLGQTTKNAKNKDVLPNGNEVVNGVVYYLIRVNPETGDTTQYALTMSSTQLKKARAWNTVIANARAVDPGNGQPFRPAMYYFSYRLQTVPESNVHGNWMGFKITKDKPVLEMFVEPGMTEEQHAEALRKGEFVYLAARELSKLAKEGKVKTKGLEDAVGGGSTPTPGDKPQGEDDERPF